MGRWRCKGRAVGKGSVLVVGTCAHPIGLCFCVGRVASWAWSVLAREEPLQKAAVVLPRCKPSHVTGCPGGSLPGPIVTLFRIHHARRMLRTSCYVLHWVLPPCIRVPRYGLGPVKRRWHASCLLQPGCSAPPCSCFRPSGPRVTWMCGMAGGSYCHLRVQVLPIYLQQSSMPG